MATIALSTIGTALGGPIGGAIGSLVGNSLDQAFFGPGPKRGPRLNDLSIQTSSYGTQIPRIYGSMRVAGSVIWATELKESSEPQTGSKGQPAAIIYSYSASFAVALSSRSAKRVGRIWADGKLLRGAAGDFKVKTGFRFYPGTEDQPIDPFIASVEGIERTPAFRGLAVAVFEELQLAEYGNRLPFLTFEIFGDEEPPTLESILADASDGAVGVDAAATIRGYAAYGASRRSALQPLVDQFAIPLFDDGGQVRNPGPMIVDVDEAEVGCGVEGEGAPKQERAQLAAGELPSALSLSFYDPARDFQTGRMRATAASASGVDEVVEFPAAIEAGQAKALAEAHIARRWAERDRLVLTLSPERLSLQPGSLLKIEDGSVWRAEEVTAEEMVVRVSLSTVSPAIEGLAADSGAHLPAPDQVASPTRLVVLDLPDLAVGRHDVPVLHVAACQPTAGWRPVPIEVTVGGEVRTIASTPGEAVIGSALNLLADGASSGFDETNFVDVELADEEHWIESRDDEALGNGANLAAIGSELVQFGRAIPIGERRFRLERLLRGRFGSEWATASHGANEAFVLIVPGTLQEVPLLPSAIGTSVSIRPRGLADDDSAATERVATGEAMRPPSPVDLRAEIQSDGVLSLTWTRRSRLGWNRPGPEVPLGESRERYRVDLQGPNANLALEAGEPHVVIPAESLTGISGGVIVTVVQLGDFAESRPASLSIEL